MASTLHLIGMMAASASENNKFSQPVDEQDDEQDDDQDQDMFYSTHESLHSVVPSDVEYTAGTKRPHQISPQPEAGADAGTSTDIAKPLEPVLTSSDAWIVGARKAGIWLLDENGNILCGYTRGRDIRWKIHEITSSKAKATSLSCNQQGHAWATDERGNLYICVNYAPEKSNEKTVERLTCYENQRWWLSPRGWSSEMLPKDRPSWSDESGLVEMPKESFALPSSRWSWTIDWTVVPGAHTDSDGWQYAQDFHKDYNPTSIESGVRRRAWKRERRITDESPWTQVSNPLAGRDKKKTSVCSVGIGTNSLWVVTDAFDIFFRGGIIGDSLEGTEWRQIPSPQSVVQRGLYASNNQKGKVAVGSVGQTWLVAPNGQAYIRRYASVSNPIGTKWLLVKGPLLRQVSVGDDIVWAVDVDGKILFRRDVTAYKPQGKSWDEVDRPSDNFKAIYISITPQPNLVEVISDKGIVFHRVGVSRSCPTGLSWSAKNFGETRMQAMACAGAIPTDQIELPPLVTGSWADKVRALIVKRNFLERSKTMFSNYHTYNDVYEITKQRRGPLRWFRDGHWKVILFELSGTTLTYSDDSQDERPSDAKEILRIESLSAIHGNVDDATIAADTTVGPIFRVEFDTRVLLLAAESQREKEGWMLSLLTAHADIEVERRSHNKVAVSRSFVPPSPDAIWALDENGNPWYCDRPSFDPKGSKLLIWYGLKPYLRDSSWGCALGRFTAITCGPGLTWALGADHCVYASNHYNLDGKKRERLKVVNSTIANGWIPIPPCLDEDGIPEMINTISLGTACVWATTVLGEVLVRWGVSQDCVIGEEWVRVPCSDFKITGVCFSAGAVWAFAADGALVTRRGFSVEHPYGSRWSLCNGLILAAFHLEGWADLVGDQPKKGVAVPDSLPEYQTQAIDATGSGDQCYFISTNNEVMHGLAAQDDGAVDWLKREPQALKKIHFGRDDILIGLTVEGDLTFKNVGTTWGGFQEWTQMASVSAYNPGKSLKWSYVSQGTGKMLSTKSVNYIVLANGTVVPRTQTKWGRLYCGSFLKRNAMMEASIDNEGSHLPIQRKWNEFSKQVYIGAQAIAYFPHDGWWYYGRVVGSKHFDNEHCYLVKLSNVIHLWLNRHHLLIDEPPDASVVYEGLCVLYSYADWKGDVKFAAGLVTKVLPSERYLIKSAAVNEGKDDSGDTEDEPLHESTLARIRLLPSSSYRLVADRLRESERNRSLETESEA